METIKRGEYVLKRNPISEKKLKINISEKKEKCLRYRHNLTQKKRPFRRAQNITMPKY